MSWKVLGNNLTPVTRVQQVQITDEATEALKHKTFKELHKSTCKDSNVKCPFEPFDLKRDHDNFEETAIGKTIWLKLRRLDTYFYT